MGGKTLPVSRWLLAGAIIVTITMAAPGHAEASLTGALSDLFNAVFAIPMGALSGTMSGPPLVGTLGGALFGAVNTLGYTMRGALQLVGVAIPLALKAAPYIPLLL